MSGKIDPKDVDPRDLSLFRKAVSACTPEELNLRRTYHQHPRLDDQKPSAKLAGGKPRPTAKDLSRDPASGLVLTRVPGRK